MKGLYIHIPFCIKKCKYCDFNSFIACGKEKESYLDALFAEMDEYKGEHFDTVFIGGGTPTSLSEEMLQMLLKKINHTFVIEKDAEFSIEANPKTVTREKLEIMLQNGVNRLSIGVQSFVDEELLAIGRAHTKDDAIETIMMARQAGFDNISIDLMTAIPKQTKYSLLETLKTALLQNPNHISCYSLILEEGTPLFDEVNLGKTTLLNEDDERELYDTAVDFLQNNGYMQYEISNFAKGGKLSRHNLKYWSCDEYIGVGLSAHSFADGVRFSNTDDFSQYISGKYHNEEKTVLTKNDMMSEFVFLGLRKIEGISKKEFQSRFNNNIYDIFKKPIKKFVKSGFLVEEGDKIYLSKDAISISNAIMCEFVL